MPQLHHSCYRNVLLIFSALILTSLFPAPLSGQLTQLSGAQTRIATNVQSGTTYTILATDCGKLISVSNTSSVVITIPEAGAGGLAAGCWMDIQNVGPGTVTLAAVLSLIDGAASVVLTANQGLRLVCNGTAYLTQRGQGSGSGSGSGTVTHAEGILAPSAIVTGNGGGDIGTPVSNATMDGLGNVSIPGTLSTNTSCIGCAGAMDLPAGTDPGTGAAHTFSWIAPGSIASSFRWKVPTADGAGAVVSDGAATPGTLSIVPLSGTGSIVRASGATLVAPTLTAPVLGSYAVAGLSSLTASVGSLAYVTDGSATTDCAVGGGLNTVLCAYSGSGWAFPGGSTGGGSLPVLISTAGPVADPGGSNYYQVNNSGGSLTFNLADGVPGYQRRLRNATGNSGAITVTPYSGNSIDLMGANATVNIASAGALADEVWLTVDVAHHWYATVLSGDWTAGSAPAACVFSGGTATSYSGHSVETFTASGTLTVTGTCTVSYLIVAGGGAGGEGGGGAGGVKTGTFTLTTGTYPVTVGAGEPAVVCGNYQPSSAGSPSSLNGIIADGGGRGGCLHEAGPAGASGGGAGACTSATLGGTGTSGEGNNGGACNTCPNYGAGGGGGAGAVGQDAPSCGVGGVGGIGFASTITGSSVIYACGGGGAVFLSGTGGVAGCGTAGAGSGSGAGTSAAANSGGGGGGASSNLGAVSGGDGGSGVVIVSN
jgi:hypothetical protein